MKLLKTLTLAAIIGCAGAISSFAQVLTETWTGPGGAWSEVNQPASDFSFASGGGILKSDQQIAGATTGTTLTVNGLTGAGFPPSMFSDGLLYTGGASGVTFSLSSTSVLNGVGYVQLTAGFGGFSILTEDSISFNFADSIVSQSFSTGVYAVDPTWGDINAATWTWEVDLTNFSGPLEFGWTLGGAHTPVGVVALTQSVEAIPEPSTFGLLGIGLLFSGYMASRRRSTAA